MSSLVVAASGPACAMRPEQRHVEHGDVDDGGRLLLDERQPSASAARHRPDVLAVDEHGPA